MKKIAGRRAAKTCECFVIQSTSWPAEDILLLLFFNLCLKRERDLLVLARANLKKLRITSKSRALRLRVGEMIMKVVQVVAVNSHIVTTSVRTDFSMRS